MAYTFKQRSDGGFDFFNGNQKTNIENYVKNTGANQNSLRTMMAQRGDKVSQQIIKNPTLNATQPSFATSKIATDPLTTKLSKLQSQSKTASPLSELDKLYSSKLPTAIKQEEQNVDWLGKLITDRDWKKRAETAARNQAASEYMAKTQNYAAPQVKSYIADTKKINDQASLNSRNAIQNTKNAVNVARYVPGAAIGEWGANMVRQNFDTPFGKKMTLDDLISEQQNIPIGQVMSMSPEEKSKLGALSQSMLGVGAALDIIPGLSGLRQVAKVGMKNLPQIAVKDLVRDMLTKQGVKKLAVNSGIGGAISSGIAAGSTKLMGGTNEQALQAAGQSFLPGVVGGVINQPYNIAENAARGFSSIKTAKVSLAQNLDATTDPAQRRNIIEQMKQTQQAQVVARSPQMLDSTTKYNVSALNPNEAYTLTDYAEMINPNSSFLKDVQNPATIQSINELNLQARNAAQTAGIDITSGSPIERQNRIIDFIEQYDNAQNPSTLETNVRQLTPEQVQFQTKREMQAGFAKIPLNKKLQDFASRNLDDGKLGKETPKTIDLLKQESMNYKSADEFIKAQGNAKQVEKAIKTIKNIPQYGNRPSPELIKAYETLAKNNHIDSSIISIENRQLVPKRAWDSATTRVDNLERIYNDTHSTPAPQVTKTPAKATSPLEQLQPKKTKELSQTINNVIYKDYPELTQTNVDTRFPNGIPKIKPSSIKEVTGLSAKESGIPPRYLSESNGRALDDVAVDMEYKTDGGELTLTGDDVIDAIKSELDVKKNVRDIPKKLAELRRKPEIVSEAQKLLNKEKSMFGVADESYVPTERDYASFRKMIERENTIASQKIVEPKTAPSTKAKSKAVSPLSQLKSSKKAKTFKPIISESRLLAQGELPTLTPYRAKQTFKKTGVTYPFATSKQGDKTIKLPESADLLDTQKVKAEVAKNLESKYQNFEKSLYGDTTAEITGGTKGANAYQTEIRSMKEGYNTTIQKGLSSENDAVRRLSRGIRTLFGSAGDTAQRTVKKGEFRGGIDESVNVANDFNELGKTMLPDKVSQERVWAVLDPELATTKVSEAELNPKELKALQTLRQASDLINDQNFAMGKISHETWLKGKGGKYITRAYEEYDVPSELKDAQMFTQPSKGKLDVGGYKARKDVDEWKQENAIKDPFYLASKRIQSTFRNKSITDYATWINKNADMVSETPKAGYTQLSESPMWGELSGKNVRKDVLTDIKGFYSDSKALQGAYDMLNACDQFLPRKTLKMTKTILNPATRLGNQIYNRVGALISGVDVARFEYNMHKFAPQELAKNGKYARLLRKEGILGTDSTKYDLAQSLVKDGAEPGMIKKALDKAKSSYGAADDKAKLAAFKAWLDSGKTVEEAITKVRNGFQDYSKVGLLYDIGAKLPIVGKPFIRFQSELTRMVKNSITENPLRAAGTVGAIALIGEMASRASGETPEDKKTREERFGTPVIPFTQIPLVFQTPIGEVNVARMFGMYESAGADTKDKNLLQRASKYLPIDIPTNEKELAKTLGNDVLTGGVMNQIMDRDFRGKPLSDPDINPKYETSTLTDAEKATNRAAAFYHNYQLPFVNDVENLGRAVIGVKDIYGKTKTPLQAGSKLTGFKVEQFGPEQAAEQRAKDAVYSDYDRKDLQSQINSVMKSQAKGEINEATANARIKELQGKAGATQSGTKSVNGIFKNPNGGFSYLDKNGSLQTADTEVKAKQEVSKMDFEKSDQNFLEKDGTIYTRNDDGTAKATPKIKFEHELNSATLTQLKSDGDIDGWLKTADAQIKNIYDQMQDKNINPIEAIKLENELDSLLRNKSKYEGYGSFTKGKSGGSTKASSTKQFAIDTATMNTTNETLNKLNNLLRGTQSYTKPTIRKAQLKRFNVKGERTS